MASPQIAGAAALMLSVNPALSPYEVAYFLGITADDLGDPGFDTISGFGRVNIENAVNAVLDDMVHNVSIESAQANPTTPGPHTLSTLQVDVMNNGNAPEAPMTVRVWVDDVVLGTQTVTLWPGESSTLGFSWTPTQAKTYKITVRCYPAFGTDADPADNEYTFYVTPEVIDVAVTAFQTLPTTIYAGAMATLRVTVANNGTRDETEARVSLTVDGVKVDATKLIAISAGGTAQMDFLWTPPTNSSTFLLATPTHAPHTVVAQVTSGRGADSSPGNNSLTRTVYADDHNISITANKVVAAKPKAGVAQTIQVTVKNSGTLQETLAYAKVYVDDVQLGAPTYFALAPGASTVVSFPWTPAVAKSYKIEARAEPTAQPDVSRADNMWRIYSTVR